jgi:small subunit ribosomal protein S23
MENEKPPLGAADDPMSIQELAYDKARKEFYQLRMDQDVERQVAKEEALHYDAYFDIGEIERSVAKESEAFEDWKVWAIAEVEKDRQMESGALAGVVAIETEGDADLQPLSPAQQDEVDAAVPVEADILVESSPPFRAK